MPLTRRHTLAVLAAGGVSAIAGAAARGAEPPKETGLSTEGLLAGEPGFQPRTVMPLPHDELPGFLSREQLAAHHAEYARDVARLIATEAQLRDGVADAERYGTLRRAHVATANAALLHELYFRNVSPTPVELPRYVVGHLHEHIGSLDAWTADFTRCALGAKAWAALVYDPYDDRWHDVMMDADDGGLWVGANPLVVCDVAEHAFAHDFARREDYVAQFVAHVDWNEVARRYKAVDRM